MERINFDFLYNLRESGQEAVVDFCIKNGLLAKSFVCMKCGRQMQMKGRTDMTDKFEWICRRNVQSNRHIFKRSIRHGSWFGGSHLPIADVLILTNFFVREIAQKHVMLELHLTSNTVCEWRNFFREICTAACFKMDEPIGGSGKCVVIDETEFCLRENSRVPNLEGNWVFGGMEVGSNKCFFKLVDNNDKNTLLNVVDKYILPGTTVYSDCWKSLDCLKDDEFVKLSKEKKLSLVIPQNAKNSKSLSTELSDIFDPVLGEYLWRRCQAEGDDLMKNYLDAVKTVFPVASEIATETTKKDKLNEDVPDLSENILDKEEEMGSSEDLTERALIDYYKM